MLILELFLSRCFEFCEFFRFRMKAEIVEGDLKFESYLRMSSKILLMEFLDVKWSVIQMKNPFSKLKRLKGLKLRLSTTWKRRSKMYNRYTEEKVFHFLTFSWTVKLP